MAIAFDTVTSGLTAAGGTGATVSVAHTCGAGTTLLLAGVAVNDGNQTNNQTVSLTYNGVTMIQLIEKDSGGDTRVEIWYMINPPTGSAHNAVITYNNINYVGMGILSFTGTATVAPTQSQGNTGTASSVSESLVPTNANSWMMDVISDESNPTTTTTIRWTNANQSFQQGRGSTTGPVTGSTAMGYTSLSSWSYAQMVIAPAAAPVSLIPIVSGSSSPQPSVTPVVITF